MNIVFAGWILIVIGTGTSYSTPTVIHKYTEEQKCKDDGEKIKKVAYVTYICLKVENYSK